jgi:pilus assembly protein CpaB
VSLRSVLVVLLALVFGASAAVGVNSLRNAPPPEPPPAPTPVETVPVVAAAVDVPRFTTLSADLLKLSYFPKDLAPPGAASSIQEVTERVVLSALVKDEPVLDAKLALRGAGRGMAPGLPHGMGAFTIQVANVSTGVAGFVIPGNKVDVLLTTKGSEAAGGASTITLLHNIEVLAVDQQVDAPAGNKVDANMMRSVTLLLTPQQALKLALGQKEGTPHLLLRNGEDVDPVPPRRVTLADIGLIPEPPKDVKAPEGVTPVSTVSPAPAKIRTLRGTQVGVVEIE